MERLVRSRGGAVAVLLTSSGLAAGLGVVVAGGRTGNGVDRAADSAVHAVFGEWMLRVLALPTDPVVLIPAVAMATVFAMLARRFAAAALIASAPAITVTLNTLVLKPLVGRHHEQDRYLAYPSGHTATLVSVLAAFVLVAGLRALLPALVVAAGAATSLIGLGYHYLTDTIGGFLVGVATVCLLALVLDSVVSARRAAVGQPSEGVLADDGREVR